MEHKDHLKLLRKGLPRQKGMWADLGSGDGAFTLALAELLDPQSEIFSVDKDQQKLLMQQELFQDMFPESNVHFVYQDFTQPLSLPPLDGILMANSLHSVMQQKIFLETLRMRLKETGRLVLVEYNTSESNMWVPYPIYYKQFEKLAKEVGFAYVEMLDKVPSEFLHEMYAAVAYRQIPPKVRISS